RKIDTVSSRFRHFPMTIDSGQAGAILRDHSLRAYEGLTIEAIEPVHDFASLLDHGQLICANWHQIGLKCRDVSGLTHRIDEEASRHAVAKAALLDLGLDCGISRKSRNRDEIQVVDGQFGNLRNHRLHGDGALPWVYP